MTEAPKVEPGQPLPLTDKSQYERSTGGRLPEWYAEQPPFVRGDDVYVLAFSLLSTDRQFDQGRMGPIPWSSAIRYARELGWSRVMRRWFATVLLILDSIHREHVREKQLRDEAKAERKSAREAKAAKQR